MDWLEKYESLLGSPERRGRGRWKLLYRCPFHDDKRPSFGVNERGFWRCFAGCGEGGYIDLCARLGKPPDLRGVNGGGKKRRPKGEQEDLRYWREQHRRVAALGAWNEQRYKAWSDYGVISTDVVDRYGLGYGRVYDSSLTSSLIVPLWKNEVLHGVKYRNEDGWSAMPRTRPVLWGGDQVMEKLGSLDEIWICEGPGDAAVLLSKTDRLLGAVALPLGSASGHDDLVEFVLEIEPRAHKEILWILALDNDMGGCPTAKVISDNVVKRQPELADEMVTLDCYVGPNDGYRMWREYLYVCAKRHIQPLPTPPGFVLLERLRAASDNVRMYMWVGGKEGDDLRSWLLSGKRV